MMRWFLLAYVLAVPLVSGAHAQRLVGPGAASPTTPGVATLGGAGGAVVQGGSGAVDTNTVTVTNGLPRPTGAQVADAPSAANYGAVCDGNSRPISTRYRTLASAQAAYPKATSLSDELDWASIQKGLDNTPRLFIPGSDCIINRHLVMTAKRSALYGVYGRSRLVTVSPTDDILQIGDGTNEVDQILLQDISFWSVVPKTAGAAVRGMSVVGRMETRGVFMGDLGDIPAPPAGQPDSYFSPLYDGFLFQDFNTSVPNAGNFGQINIQADIHVQHYGIAVANGTGVFLGNLARITGAQVGIYARGNVGGLVVSNSDISGSTVGIKFDQSLTALPNREFFVDTNSSIDRGLATAVDVETNGLGLMRYHGWMAATPYCLYVAAGTMDIGATYHVVGAHVQSCTTIGLAVNDGRLIVSGSEFKLNGSVSNASPYSSIYDTTAWGSIITGNLFADGGVGGASGGNDIIFTGGANYFVVTGNYGTGTVSNGFGTSATRKITNNLGSSTWNP